MIILMMGSLHYWLRLLIWCLGLWGCGWLANGVWKSKKEKGLIPHTHTIISTINQMLRTTFLNTAKIVLGVVLGMAAIDLWQYHHTYVVVNAVVDTQIGRDVAYHFESDPYHQSYAWHFCEDRFLPEFKPGQIVDKMQFVRSRDSTGECEDLSPGSTSLRLRRINGVPVIDGDGD